MGDICLGRVIMDFKNIYVIIDCDGYDESPNHELLWADVCNRKEAVEQFIASPRVAESLRIPIFRRNADDLRRAAAQGNESGTVVLRADGISLLNEP